ncbi:putative zinc finger CCCH domain-containing protein 21 [Typha latifolia]|uniref:putative zinc finger CCCH domain-containing protein 21 n=1 Tax=Typha latifolia TaxID=4733 RepID=UPI003C2C1F7B
MEPENIPPLPEYDPIAASPTSCCSFDDEFGGSAAGSVLWIASDDQFEIQKDRILRELQQMVNRYNECFRRLLLTNADLEALRRENLDLSASNLHLTFLIDEREAAVSLRYVNPEAKGQEKEETIIGGGDDPDTDRKSGTRGGLPKSISIRSRGFLAGKGKADGEARPPQRLRVPVAQAVEEGEEEEVEVEVYNQGMEKTELCNKWGEGGGCPYGERCRFAHGIQELRPVIRHPRYKTQLCRMLGKGGECPYGHRCHFRHAFPPTPRDQA